MGACLQRAHSVIRAAAGRILPLSRSADEGPLRLLLRPHRSFRPPWLQQQALHGAPHALPSTDGVLLIPFVLLLSFVINIGVSKTIEFYSPNRWPAPDRSRSLPGNAGSA